MYIVVYSCYILIHKHFHASKFPPDEISCNLNSKGVFISCYQYLFEGGANELVKQCRGSQRVFLKTEDWPYLREFLRLKT